jgi:hypothetical protein
MSYRLTVTVFLAVCTIAILYYSYEIINRPHTDIIQTKDNNNESKDRDFKKKKLNLIVILPTPDIKNRMDKSEDILSRYNHTSPLINNLSLFNDLVGEYSSKKYDNYSDTKDLDLFKPKQGFNKPEEGSFLKRPNLFFDTKSSFNSGESVASENEIFH